jgi:hypothetical protein
MAAKLQEFRPIAIDLRNQSKGAYFVMVKGKEISTLLDKKLIA